MKEIAGIYTDCWVNPSWISSYLQSVIYPNKLELIDNKGLKLNYQNNNYLIRIKENKIDNHTLIWVYSDSIITNDLGYTDTRGVKVSTTHTIGLPFLLRCLISQIAKIEMVECEIFNPEDFRLITNNLNQRLSSNLKLINLYSSSFDINQNLIDSNIVIGNIEIIQIDKIIAQPCNFLLFSSEKKNKSIEEFILKLGIELGWDNTFYLETLFIPYSYSEMVNRFRTDWSLNWIKKLKLDIDENLKINMLFKEDELSFIIETSSNYIFIEELFWWS